MLKNLHYLNVYATKILIIKILLRIFSLSRTHSSLLHLFLCVLFIMACESKYQNVKEGYNPSLPPSIGESHGMTIIADTTLWNHGINKKLTPILQKNNREYETFDIATIPPQALNDIFKRSYNLLFIITLDNNSTMGRMMLDRVAPKIIKEVKEKRKEWLIPIKNLYANGQRVVFIVVNDEIELFQKLTDEGDRLLHYFESHLQFNIIEKLKKKGLATHLFEVMNKEKYQINIPKDYSLALDSINFQWYRKILGANYDENIIVYHVPYEDERVFTTEGLLEFREKMTKTFLSDPENKNLYITTQEIYPMETRRIESSQAYIVEAEGYWKTSNSTRGGPYYGRAMLDPSKKHFYYVEYWLYSPETSKDKPLRNLRAIIESFKFVKD